MIQFVSCDNNLRFVPKWNRMLKKKTTKIAALVPLFLLVLVIYMLLWGKLFVFSPMHPGFIRSEFKRITVYVQDGSKDYDYKKLDALIPEVEKFHDLKFAEKPKIFFFCDKSSYLQRSISNARFFVFPNGSLVVSPWAIDEGAKGEISVELYVEHELSHVLLYQNMKTSALFSYPNWLMEGVAVYSSTWYPSKAETYNYIKQGNFMPPEYFKTGKEDSVKLNVKYRITFMYSEFACIVEYLIKTEGKEKFMLYMKRLLEGGNHSKVFKEVYGVSFDEFIAGFRGFVEKSK